MAKAHISKADGTSIIIEGSPEEVAAVMSKIEGHSTAPKHKPQATPSSKEERKTGINQTLPDILLDLKADGFFKQPKDLAAVKLGLAELGEVYGVNTIAPTLLRLVKSRQLRRIKQEKRWCYTG